MSNTLEIKTDISDIPTVTSKLKNKKHLVLETGALYRLKRDWPNYAGEKFIKKGTIILLVDFEDFKTMQSKKFLYQNEFFYDTWDTMLDPWKYFELVE